MPKPRRTVGHTSDITDIALAVNELQQIFMAQIGLGYDKVTLELLPDPNQNRPITRIGTSDNIWGAWLEIELTEANDINSTNPVRCTHQLGTQVGEDPTASTRPLLRLNAHWFLLGYQHDGTGSVTTTLDIKYIAGDSMTTNSIDLRFTVGGAPTIDTDHPLRVTLFFVPVGE